jgi:cytochrome c oxidase subunit 4
MAQAGHHREEHPGHHIVPKKILFTVFGALVFLTVFTVITAQLDLGGFNVPLALAIAFTKAGLVLAFFMALKYDNRVNTLVFSLGAVFVVVFLTFTLFDTALRGSLGMMDEAGTVADQQRAEAALQAQDPGLGTPTVAAPDTTATESGEAPDGAVVFTTYMCNTCHSLDGSAGAGPSLQGVGSRRTRDEVIQSIREPDAVIVEGFSPGVMGATLNAFGFATITDAEFEALVDYLMNH